MASQTPSSNNSTDIAAFNALPTPEAESLLMTCLGVPRWAHEVASGRPYDSAAAALAAAEGAARELSDEELAAAVSGHPRIGERASSPEHQSALSEREQSGVDPSDAQAKANLAQGNEAYEERFDRVFLIRAAGRSAPEILTELNRRLDNDHDTERTETVTQLREIAVLRLQEML